MNEVLLVNGYNLLMTVTPIVMDGWYTPFTFSQSNIGIPEITIDSKSNTQTK